MTELLLLCWSCALGQAPPPPEQPHRQPAVVDPNDYAGTDSERLNQAVQAAAAGNGTVVVPRRNARGGEVWLLDSAILLPANVTVLLDGCRLKLSDRCRDNFFRSANCGLGLDDIRPLANIHLLGRGGAVLEGADQPRATGDSAKTLGAQTYGTDAGVRGESQRGDWRNIGILLANVTGFSIENLLLRDSHCWAVSLEYCSHGRLRDLAFESTGRKVIDGQARTILNQDGVDLRQGCHEILIENLTGRSGDDLLALTAIPHAGAVAGRTGSTMVSGAARGREPRDEDIHHITIRNVTGHCAGGHHIVRFLNTGGLKLHDVLLDGLLDTSPPGVRCRAAVKIGDHNPAYGGVTPVGDTARLIINNVVSRAAHTVLIGGSLVDSTLGTLVRFDGPGETVTLESGPQCVRNVRRADGGVVGASPGAKEAGHD